MVTTWQRVIGIITTILVATAIVACDDDDPAPPGPPFTVKIIGFNDYHGNLQSPGTFGVNTSVPAAQRPPVGGAEYIAAHVARLKAQNPLNVVVGAGDFIGATPLISALFFDEPAVETLNRIGVEFNAVGNHEFDKGAAELLRLQNGGCKITNGAQDPNSCKGAAVGHAGSVRGREVQVAVGQRDLERERPPLLPAYGIKTFNGVTVAFIGMTLKATPTIVTPTGVAGLEFRDEARRSTRWCRSCARKASRRSSCSVHEGGFQTGPTLGDINGCDGNLAGSAIAGIVAQLDDAVDLVVSGHTHAAYNCSATVDVKPTAAVSTPRPTGCRTAGRLMPVTSASAFGRVLTDIDVTIDPATRDDHGGHRDQPAGRCATIRRDRPPTRRSRNIVNAYNGLVSPIANQVIGSITAALPNTAQMPPATCRPAT